MSQGFFRKEVLEARRSRLLGRVSLSQPISHWVLTGTALAVTLIVGALLALGSFTRRTSVGGQLVPSMGLAMVFAPATGVVTSLEFEEGDRVDAGSIVAVVKVPRETVSTGNISAALSERLQARLESLRISKRAEESRLESQMIGLKRQLREVNLELEEIMAEVANREDQVQLATEVLERLRQLEDSKFVSVIQLKQQENAVLSFTGDAQSLRRQSIEKRRIIAQIEQSIADAPKQNQLKQEELAREIEQIEQERIEIGSEGEFAISASIDGLIAARSVKIGETVKVGQQILSILPADARLEAELLVPSRAIGFIDPGDRVLMRYESYPYQKFGHQPGTVLKISHSALSDNSVATMTSGQVEPLYRVIVGLDKQDIAVYGSHEQLIPGMRLEADILGEKRRLVEWLFEPLFSLRERVSSN